MRFIRKISGRIQALRIFVVTPMSSWNLGQPLNEVSSEIFQAFREEKLKFRLYSIPRNCFDTAHESLFRKFSG
jgi:hypothetical protein